MTDEDILNFMDAQGIQCWPEWSPSTTPAGRDITIRNWVAQSRKPFIQCSRKTLRAAVVDLYHQLQQGGTTPIPQLSETEPRHYKD